MKKYKEKIEIVKQKEIKRLNIGCGKDYKKGFINLDYNDMYKPA